MTGKIKVLSSHSGSGYIEADSGLGVYFDAAAVMAFDLGGLSVGQAVTFDLASGAARRAINVVCVHRLNDFPTVGQKPPEPLRPRSDISRLRYVGFDMHASVRAYTFAQVAPGEVTRTYIVTIDMALFARHHVGIQEGPSLCLRLLTAELEAEDSPAALPERALTDQHMLDHLSSRPLPKGRMQSKRPARVV